MARHVFTISGLDDHHVGALTRIARSRNRSRSAEIVMAVEAHIAKWRDELRAGKKMPEGTK